MDLPKPRNKSTTCRRASPLCLLDPLLRELTTIRTTETVVVIATILNLDTILLQDRTCIVFKVLALLININPRMRDLDLLPATVQAKMTVLTVLAMRLLPQPAHTVHPTTKASTSATMHHLALIIALLMSIVPLRESLRAKVMLSETMIAAFVHNVADAVLLVEVAEAQEWRLKETS